MRQESTSYDVLLYDTNWSSGCDEEKELKKTHSDRHRDEHHRNSKREVTPGTETD